MSPTLLERFEELRPSIIESLHNKIVETTSWMKAAPEDFMDYGVDEPSCDVRLRVREIDGALTYFIHTGQTAYDQDHRGGVVYAASCFCVGTKAETLADDLMEQISNEIADCFSIPE